MPVFGDVDQIEEHAECPGHDRGLRLVEPGDPRVEGGFGRVVTGPPSPREPADLLHERDRLGAGQRTDHVAQHVAEQANVTPQKFVIDHGWVPEAG